MFNQYVKYDYMVAAEFSQHTAIDLMQKHGGTVHFKMDGTVRNGQLDNYVVQIGDLVTNDGKIVRSSEGWENIESEEI